MVGTVSASEITEEGKNNRYSEDRLRAYKKAINDKIDGYRENLESIDDIDVLVENISQMERSGIYFTRRRRISQICNANLFHLISPT